MIDRFTDAFLDEVRASVSITDVIGQHVQWDAGKSNPGRRDMWACCPFHAENSPSFHAQDDEGVYHCFGCGASGDHFQFIMALQGGEFPDAVRAVADLGGIALPDEAGGERKPSRPPEQPRQTKTPPQPSAASVRPEIVKTYDYTDRDGALLYQVCRLQRKMPDGRWALNKDGKGKWKSFLQRRPDGAGKWIWGLSAGEFMRRPGGDWRQFDKNKFADGMETRFFPAGADHTIYRHPTVEIAIADGAVVICAEGEKDADTATALGFCGTTNSSGSKHWTDTHAACFQGADVVICLDNDAAGDRADKLAQSMKGIARRIRVLNFADHVPGFEAKGDITDWVEHHGGTAEGLADIIACLPAWRPRPPASKFGAQRAMDLANKPIVYDWLIKHLVERNGVLIVAGESQAGKSFFVMDMGMKIARGLEYGNRKTRQGLVIHMASEDGRGTELRAEGYRKANGISPDEDVPYLVMDPHAKGALGFSLMSDESVDKFIAECLEWKAYYGGLELVIIDTVSAGAEGLDENSSAEVTKMLTRVNRIRDMTGATVCLVHHMNAAATRIRGSSALVANVANVIEVRPMMTIPKRKDDKPEIIKDSDGRPMRRAILTKNKNGLNDVKWTFVLQEVVVGLDQDGEQQTTCICAKASRQRDEPEERHKMSPDTQLVFDALQAAMADAGQDMPAGSASATSVKRCAPQAAFEANVRKTMTFTASEDEIEKRNVELKTLIKRTTTTLINAGYMGRDNDLKICWWTGKSDRPRPRYSEPERPQEQPGAGIPDEIRRELASGEPPF